MKVISFSIFDRTYYPFELGFYLRGLYFNIRMAKLLYPGWKVSIHASSSIMEKHGHYLAELNTEFRYIDLFNDNDAPLCEMMLWRMLPIWWGDVTHVICRDSDAMLTYREAQSVQLWVNSGKNAHMILDSPAHGGLMGGMVGFKAEVIRNSFASFESLRNGFDLSKRGSDQELLNKRVLPLVKDSLFVSNMEAIKPNSPPGISPLPTLNNVDPKLWESNLTCRHIGSAGAVDMEVLRFFKRFDKTDYSEFERKFPDIFYWTK